MSNSDPSVPVHDPDQFVLPDFDEGKHYPGNADVVHRFVGQFALDVMKAYDEFLAGRATSDVVMPRIQRLIKQYDDVFMGRDTRFEIAPWQGERMRGKLLGAIDAMKGDDDPGEALFNHLALQCIKGCQAIARGHDEEECGEHLKEILDDVRARILGVVV